MRGLAALASMVALAGCPEHGARPPGQPDAPGTDAGEVDRTCPNGGREKLKFTFAQSCGNDGSVEFCIPDGNLGVQMRVTGVSAAIRCQAGGGVAGCSNSGRLRCAYPTSFPTECTTSHGAMTEETWLDMCDLAAIPEIVEIVPTFFE